MVYVKFGTEHLHHKQCVSFREHRKESGSAILTSMMYTALVMFIVISLLDFITLRSRDNAASKLSTQRNQLMYWIRHEVRSGLNIYASIGLPENAELKKCIVYDAPAGDPPGQCLSPYNPAAVSQAVRFISDKLVPITGSSKTDPVNYAADGTPCISGSTCVFSVWTDFTSTCRDPGWWSCNTAKDLLVSIHISQIGDSTKLSERVEIQLVPIQDWGQGQWSLVSYDSTETVPDSDKPAAPTPTPDPDAPPADGGGGGSPATPTPTSVPSVPVVPTPEPVPPKASCGQGQVPVGNSCEKFSL